VLVLLLKMMKIQSCCLLGVLFFASTAFSQNAEKIYSIANPYGSAMRIESLVVDDSANFRVESLKPLPFDLPESGTLDFKVAILPHDGIMRTTQVHFGTTSYTIQMEAPLSASVKNSNAQMQSSVYPNPVKDFCTINIDISLYPNIEIELFNSIGGNVVSMVQPVGHSLSLDARNLASGSYHLMIKSNGALVRSEEIIVKH
jgi:hypothetical protein